MDPNFIRAIPASSRLNAFSLFGYVASSPKANLAPLKMSYTPAVLSTKHKGDDMHSKKQQTLLALALIATTSSGLAVNQVYSKTYTVICSCPAQDTACAAAAKQGASAYAELVKKNATTNAQTQYFYNIAVTNNKISFSFKSAQPVGEYTLNILLGYPNSQNPLYECAAGDLSPSNDELNLGTAKLSNPGSFSPPNQPNPSEL